MLDGEYIEFYPNKSLKVKGGFSKGQKSGTWITWDDKVEYISSYEWRKGQRNGSFREYNNGTLVRQGHYKDDELNGEVLIYPLEENGKHQYTLFLPKFKVNRYYKIPINKIYFLHSIMHL